MFIFIFLISSLLVANPQVNTPTATIPVKISLNSTDTQLIAKVKNQVQEYQQYSRTNSLNTLGKFLEKEILSRITSLYNTFYDEVSKSQKRDTAQNMLSKPYKSLAYCILFFSTITEALKPLITKYNNLKETRTAKKHQAASKKLLDPSLNEDVEYFSIKKNIILPYENLKEIGNQATTSSLLKLLEYTNW